MENLVEIKNLIVSYKTLKNKNEFVAVNDVSLNIREGEIYALAGESGCGKTTLAKCLIKLIKPNQGAILFGGKDIYNEKNDDRNEIHKSVQMVFQNPHSSLNPKMKIVEILKEPLDINTKFSNTRKMSVIKNILSEVGLDNDALLKYPHEFSGGQKQRIAIARALILNPRLIIADEPVSALDASIQAQIINLFKVLKKERNLTILFISHDLNVIRYLADRVGIMQQGRLIEENVTSTLFVNPKQEYTKTLLNSSPLICI